MPFLLMLFGAIAWRLTRVGIFRRWFRWLEELSRRRGMIVERLKKIGLMLFLSVLRPMRRLWAGSFAATIFVVKFRPAFIRILGGVCIA